MSAFSHILIHLKDQFLKKNQIIKNIIVFLLKNRPESYIILVVYNFLAQTVIGQSIFD